jgi:hypothetical protein
MASTGFCGIGRSCPEGTVCVDGWNGSICVASGEEGQPCNLVGEACDGEALRCQESWSLCGEGLGPCCVHTGDEGELCMEGAACADPALECGWFGNCPDGLECCRSTGALDEPCTLDNTCDLGLLCVDGWNGWTNTCPDELGRCCRDAAGGEGEPCSVNGECDGGYACVESWMWPDTCPENMWHCCTATGQDRQPCNSDGSCDAGLGCLDDQTGTDCPGDAWECCQPAGIDYQRCYSDYTCDQGYFCGFDSGCPDETIECCIPENP